MKAAPPKGKQMKGFGDPGKAGFRQAILTDLAP
jgi:hypothetical protein